MALLLGGEVLVVFEVLLADVVGHLDEVGGRGVGCGLISRTPIPIRPTILLILQHPDLLLLPPLILRPLRWLRPTRYIILIAS